MYKTNFLSYFIILICQLFISINSFAIDNNQGVNDPPKGISPPSLNAQQKEMAKQFEKMIKLMQEQNNRLGGA
ncbi:MAG: hypothetical protein L3J98_12420 [Gammaproteobacteria bacterium]|nr:hypothetical protein [Gammaproteobacteria bacterium]MCF6260940.1 hypothetical protein [Gammaproteobacteria bacterium]